MQGYILCTYLYFAWLEKGNYAWVASAKGEGEGRGGTKNTTKKGRGGTWRREGKGQGAPFPRGGYST